MAAELMDDIESQSDDSVLFELYHENSKQRRNDFDFNRRIATVNNSPDLHRVISRAFKGYPGAQFTALPEVQLFDGRPFEWVAASRRSIRRFSAEPLSIESLAKLAFFANGITGRLDESTHGIVQPVRSAPSGGALYPIEMYVVATNVDRLEPGLYHYAVDRHGLELLVCGHLNSVLSEVSFDPALFSQAPAAFIFTGVFGRAYFKYGERGYRFTLLEAGHICQNLLLAATALDLGAVAVGGFIDDEVNQLLDLDGVDEAALCITAVGHAAPRPVPRSDAGLVVDRLLKALTTE